MKKKGFLWAVFIAVALSYKIGNANIIVVPDLNYPLHGIGIGTRAIGMGGAFVALADDPSAIWWNPAGLSKVERLSVYGEMSYLHEEGEFIYGYIYDSGNRYVSYSKGSFVPKAIVLTIPYRDMGIGIGAYVPYCSIKEDGGFTWKNKRIKLAEKGKVTRAEFSTASGKSNGVNIGLTIGYQWLTIEERSFYHEEYDGWESVRWNIEEFAGKGFSTSMGGIWKIGEHSSVGIAMGTQTPFQGKKKYQYYRYYASDGTIYEDTTYIGDVEEERILPRFLRVGACIESEKGTIVSAQIDFLHHGYYRDWYGVFPALYIPYSGYLGSANPYFHAGIEHPVKENITLRAGVYSSPRDSYYGRDVLIFTSGFTVKWYDLRFEGVIENMVGGDDKMRIGSLSALYEW